MPVLEAEAPPRHRAHEKYDRLIARAQRLQPARTAIAHPCDKSSLESAVEGAKSKLIVPILVGPKSKIEKAAAENNFDISNFDIVDAAHSHDAAGKAVALVRDGRVEA